MMSTARMDEATKERLRRLQEAWNKARGERPSQKDLLSHALEYLERHQQDFVSEGAWRPLTPDEIERLEAAVLGHYGGGLSDDIDAAVYGE